MSPETKLWISRYLHVTWRMPPWMPWSDNPRAGGVPSRGGAGHQARAANRDYIVTVINRLYLSVPTVSGTGDVDYTHSDTARDKFHWFPPPDYVWTDCVAVVLSAVSCQATLQLSVWQIQIAQCPDSGTSLTHQSLVPASTGQCCIDASIDIYVVQWQYCTSYHMNYFLYEVIAVFLAFYFINTSCYIFSPHIVEKLSFKRNFGLIQNPNELATDYSYSFSLFWWLHA